MRPRYIYLENQKFGKLSCLKWIEGRKYLVKCDCGKEYVTHASNIKRNKSGCSECSVQVNRPPPPIVKHGMYKSTEYRRWWDMKLRCESPSNSRFKDYGGRGIRVTPEWQEFKQFYEDMGPCPKGFFLDKIDNDKNYSKENCRWVSCKESARNRRTTVLVTFGGMTKSIKEWTEFFGLTPLYISYRRSKGIPVPKILEQLFFKDVVRT